MAPPDARALRAAVAPAGVTSCGLRASLPTCQDRVTAREPNDYWRAKLRGLVDTFFTAQAANHFVDHEVSSEDQSAEQTARELLTHLRWI